MVVEKDDAFILTSDMEPPETNLKSGGNPTLHSSNSIDDYDVIDVGPGRCVDSQYRYYTHFYKGGTFYHGSNYFTKDTYADWCCKNHGDNVPVGFQLHTY